MPAADPLATPDARALCAAIDAGNDACLPLLADLLEEAGDARAAELRRFATLPLSGLRWDDPASPYPARSAALLALAEALA